MIAWIVVYYSNRNLFNSFISSFYSHIENCQLYVVDNSTKNELQKLIGKTLTVLSPEKNLGFGGGVNYAINYIERESTEITHYVISNYDIAVNSELALGFKQSLNLAPSKTIISPIILSNKRLWFGPSKISKFKMCPHIKNFGGEVILDGRKNRRSTEFVSGCFILVEKDTWSLLGGFDERFFMYDEDVDLSLRAGKLGIELLVDCSWKIEHIAQGSFANTEQSIDQLSPRNPSFDFYVRNTILNRKELIRKHFDNSTLRHFSHSAYWTLKSFQLILMGEVWASVTIMKVLLNGK